MVRKERERIRASASRQDAGHPSLATLCPHLQCLLGNEGPGLFQTQGTPFLREHLFVLEQAVIDRETYSG